MDSRTFDRLTRGLAGEGSRRGILRGIASAALGAVAIGGAAREAAACVDVDSNRRCNRDNDCCGDDARCRNNRCSCKSGFRACRQNGKVQCFDRRNDDEHCGRCGRRCKSGDTCQNGRCRPDGGVCADLGQPCNDIPCCAGLRCAAGNDAFRACTL